MRLKLENNALQGTITIPPSKSAAHRALICASLAKGESKLSNVGNSKDIEATISALKSLGASIIEKDNLLLVKGALTNTNTEVFCGESGSTLRFLIPVALMNEGSYSFKGQGRLMQRPLEEYFKIFNQNNIHHYMSEDSLHVQGVLSGGEYKIRGNISSQYITGLLLALPLAETDSKIIIEGELESRSYVDMTIEMQSTFGVKIEETSDGFFIKGKQEYKPKDIEIEGDFSQAAFWIVANALGSDIKLKGLKKESLQGDKVMLKIAEQAGCKSVFEDDFIHNNGKAELPICADVADCPDIVPILAVLCCALKGKSEIVNAARLRLKESDRLAAITKELSKLGAQIIEESDQLIINGGFALLGGEVECHNDHRIAMALAIASQLCSTPVIINGAECVGKSYPDFWAHYKMLGGKVNECSLG